jgi:hypothetical protein
MDKNYGLMFVPCRWKLNGVQEPETGVTGFVQVAAAVK